jgi:hypothetical protein
MSDGREHWDAHAATFDDEADHGLRDPAVRAAWAGVLTAALPAAPAWVVDIGCGTGSVAVLLAEARGRLVIVEGHWSTGAGIPAVDGVSLVRRHRGEAEVRPLRDEALWGGPITDERYLLLSRH